MAPPLRKHTEERDRSLSFVGPRGDIPVPAISAGTHSQVLKLFSKFDTSGDGYIDRDELRQVLQGLNPEGWTDAKFDTLLAALDMDGDGQVSLEEFLGLVWSPHSPGVLGQFRDALERMRACPPPASPKGRRSRRQTTLSEFRGSFSEDVDADLNVDVEINAEGLVRALRRQTGLEEIPLHICSRVADAHSALHGPGVLKYKGIAPEGGGQLLFMLADTSSSPPSSHVYRVLAESCVAASGGVEAFRAAESRLTDEIRLICFLSLRIGGGEQLLRAQAEQHLPEAMQRKLLTPGEMAALGDAFRRHRVLATFKEMIPMLEEQGMDSDEAWGIYEHMEELSADDLELQLADAGIELDACSDPPVSLNWIVCSLLEADLSQFPEEIE